MSTQTKLFAVKAYNRIKIERGTTLEAKRQEILREVGSDNFQSVEVATPQDIAWFCSMSGTQKEDL